MDCKIQPFRTVLLSTSDAKLDFIAFKWKLDPKKVLIRAASIQMFEAFGRASEYVNSLEKTDQKAARQSERATFPKGLHPRGAPLPWRGGAGYGLGTLACPCVYGSLLCACSSPRPLSPGAVGMAANEEHDKSKVPGGAVNLKMALSELAKADLPTSPSSIPKGARIIRLGPVKKPVLGTIIGGRQAPQLTPQVARVSSSSCSSLAYNDRVEWKTTEDGAELVEFRSTRYPNHTFKFFVSTRANGDKFAYCMQCLDVNQRRTELQQSVRPQPTIQIINKRLCEHPDFPKESHICMDKEQAEEKKKNLPDTSNLRVIRFKNSALSSPQQQLQQAGPYRALSAGRPIGSGINKGRIVINNYKLRFSVDAMKILRDTPGGSYIIEEMMNARGDASKVPNRVRLSLVRIMTEYLMQNCMRPGFPTTNERITYTQMFLAQLPVAFEVLPFSRPKGYIDKRIKRLRHSLSARKRINGNVPMPLVLASRNRSGESSSGKRSQSKSMSRSDDDDDFDDESGEEGDENEEEESQMDETGDSQMSTESLGEEDDEGMDVEGSTNNLLLNVIEDQIMNEQVKQKGEKVTINVSVNGQNAEDDKAKEESTVVDPAKPSTSSSPQISTITTSCGRKRKVIVIRSNQQNGDITPPKMASLISTPSSSTPRTLTLTPAQSRDFTARRSYLQQLKQTSPEKYVSRFMDRYPLIFQSNRTIHEEFLNVCPQARMAQPGNFAASWKAFWMRRVMRYVKSLNIDEVFDLDASVDEDTVSRHAFDQLLFVFMTKQREYFRDHLWKIVLKCSSIDDLNKLTNDGTPIEHPIIVQLTRGVASQYFVVCDKEIIPVEGKFTEALQLLVELYQIFGMEYPWEYVRWFQFFEHIYGIRTPASLENRKLFGVLKAMSLKT
uniref:PID domain-containing protein n=1 Tax=Steinernema glaseri TaxID=37863 RepID=A0A1I7Z384_9BILA